MCAGARSRRAWPRNAAAGLAAGFICSTPACGGPAPSQRPSHCVLGKALQHCVQLAQTAGSAFGHLGLLLLPCAATTGGRRCRQHARCASTRSCRAAAPAAACGRLQQAPRGAAARLRRASPATASSRRAAAGRPARWQAPPPRPAPGAAAAARRACSCVPAGVRRSSFRVPRSSATPRLQSSCTRCAQRMLHCCGLSINCRGLRRRTCTMDCRRSCLTHMPLPAAAACCHASTLQVVLDVGELAGGYTKGGQFMQVKVGDGKPGFFAIASPPGAPRITSCSARLWRITSCSAQPSPACTQRSTQHAAHSEPARSTQHAEQRST